MPRLPLDPLRKAAKICEAAARRYVQNTGTSTFQSDSVDRRSQSGEMARRAKELLEQYGSIMGLGSGQGGDASSVPGAAAVRRLDIAPSHHRGRLWRRE